jgi:serine/threonine protein kinase/Tol biopolymer transport system component
MPISAGARLGSFEVLGPLGAGGMGEVYRARDTRLGREVALKVLPEALSSDRERLARFEQEARAASALNHPNIVTIHEIGREGDTTFVAMELVDGKTLRELSVPGPMPVKRVLSVASQVSEGLAKAHAAGIVHRDLKPENVMLSADGFVKILDFGLAKLMETDSSGGSALPTMAQPETRPGTVMGTVGYMSPEQASGEQVDYRSDQFSLGSVLYEMLTGKKPFLRKTAAETMSAIIREEPEPATRLRPDLPLPVRWVLDRCMAKDREERYASTRDLARDLSGLRDHLSEASSGALTASPARPRPRFSLLAAAAAVALAASLAGWLAARTFGSRSLPTPSFKRLSFQRGTIGNARFTPSGEIVYGLHLSGPGFGTQLLLARADSPQSKPFDFEGDILSISKSGELAIWQVATGVTGTVAVVPMSGGAPRPLVEDVVWASADWDPQSAADMAVVRVTGGKARLEFPIGNVVAAEGVFGVRFAPDGRELAFFSDEGDEIALRVMDRQGKKAKTLTSGWRRVEGLPCWAAGGREIWFTGSQAGEPEALWAVRRSGEVRRLIRVPGSLELYDVAADGRALLGHHSIVSMLQGLAPGQVSEIALSWLDSSRPSDLSVDGSTVLITEDGEGAGGRPSIYVRPTDGGPAVRIGEGFGVALSPDKKWVLARREENERRTFVLIPTGPGQPRPLTFEGLDVTSAAFTPDGLRIVFDATAAGQPSRLFVAELSGGKPRPVGPPNVRLQPFTSPVSPDGRRVVALREGKLVALSLDGAGEPRELPGLRAGMNRAVQWSSDGRSVYYVQRTPHTLKVDLYDVETGARQPWKEIPVDESTTRQFVRVTPDGRGYVHSGIQVSSELYLLEGLR